MTKNSSSRDLRRGIAGAATVTVVGGTLVVGVDGTPVSAATFEVSNRNASGAGSLARAVDDANDQAGADTITFVGEATSGTIDIGATSLRIKDDLTIVGPGRNLVVTNSASDLLYLYNGASLTLSGVTLDEAGEDAIAGSSATELVVTDVTISKATSDGIDVSGLERRLSLGDVDIDDPGNRGVRVAESGTRQLEADLDDVVVAQATYGIDISGVNDFSISNSSVTESSNRGIDIYSARRGGSVVDTIVSGSGSEGVYIRGTENAGDVITVERVEITDSGEEGLELFGDAGVVIRDVLIARSGDDGLDVDGAPTGITIERLSVDESGADGITLYDAVVGDVTVRSVTITDSSDNGLEIFDMERNVIVDDVRIDRSGELGMYVWEVDRDTTITNVEITSSAEQGLRVADMSGPVAISAMTITGSGENALYVESNDQPVVVTNSTISGNETGNFHTVDANGSDLILRHSTVASNSTSTGFVFDSSTGDTITLDHTIVADNGEVGVHGGDGSITADYSLFDEDSGFDGTNIEAADPLLDPLADNGGATRTMLPRLDSPAVDAGNPDIGDAPLTDQRGLARISGAAIDVGAVELPPVIQSTAPSRFADTRDGQATFDGLSQGGGKRSARTTYEVQIAGRGAVPADATSVVINVTAVQPDAAGFVTAYACDQARPLASSLNYAPGSNVGNEIIAGLSADGKVCLYVEATTHLTVDVVGFTTPSSRFVPVLPARAFETRVGEATADGRFENIGRMAGGSQERVAMTGRNGVPSGAGAVVMNITAIRPDGDVFVTVHPCLDEVPLASSLNVASGAIKGNEIIAELDDTGSLCVFVSNDTDLTIDVVGYLPAGGIRPVAPARLLETRDGQRTVDGEAQGGGPVAAESTTRLAVSGRAGVPGDAKSVVVNVTAINPSARGFVTVSPCVTPTPLASSLNYEEATTAGNEVIAELDETGALCLFTPVETHLAVDIVGYIR